MYGGMDNIISFKFYTINYYCNRLSVGTPSVPLAFLFGRIPQTCLSKVVSSKVGKGSQIQGVFHGNVSSPLQTP